MKRIHLKAADVLAVLAGNAVGLAIVLSILEASERRRAGRS